MQPAHLEQVAVAGVAVGETHVQVVPAPRIAHIGGVVHPHEVRISQKPRRTVCVGSDVDADFLSLRRDLFKPFHPFFPKIGVECDARPRGGRVPVSAAPAGTLREAVYLEIGDVVEAAELAHPVREVADVARVSRAHVAGAEIDVIAYLFQLSCEFNGVR